MFDGAAAAGDGSGGAAVAAAPGDGAATDADLERLVGCPPFVHACKPAGCSQRGSAMYAYQGPL